MAAPVNLKGASGHLSEVDSAGAALVCDRRIPVLETSDSIIPFRQYLTDDGTATGTNDMQVSASAASPQDFFISAVSDGDIYITALSFVIADQNATLNSFGAVTALTNGCQLLWQTTDRTVTIHDALQSNWDFVRLCQGQPAFGDSAAAFRASNVSGNSEGYTPALDIRTVFGMPWGIKLRQGTVQKLIMRVRDDTTGVDQFDCIAYGFERFPD